MAEVLSSRLSYELRFCSGNIARDDVTIISGVSEQFDCNGFFFLDISTPW